MHDAIETQKQQIVSFFERQGSDYWKTVNQIVRYTKLDTSSVIRILSTDGDFVRSSYRLKAGEPLFTTRKLFRNKAPFVDKMIGVFKNRID